MNRLRAAYTLALLLFAGISLAAVYGTAARRQVLVTDVAIAADTPAGNGPEITRTDLGGDAADADILLPLPEDVHFEHVSFENRYMTKELLIRLQTDDAHFYETHAVPCNTEKVQGIRSVYTAQTRSLDLSFRTSASFEPEPQVSEGEVLVKLRTPQEMHTLVAVLDPAVSGTGDSALRIAEAVREKAEASGEGLRVYLTRTDPVPATEEACLALVREVSAERFLRLEGFDEGALAASAYYNDAYFLRGYGNVELATDAERALAGINGLTAEGVIAVRDAPVLSSLRIPACTLRLTGLRGEEERIAQAADAIYESLRPEQEETE